MLFGSSHDEGVKAVHLQKLGIVSSKRTDLDIYSLMIQVAMNRKTLERKTNGNVIVTLGNLNAEGIAV